MQCFTGKLKLASEQEEFTWHLEIISDTWEISWVPSQSFGCYHLLARVSLALHCSTSYTVHCHSKLLQSPVVQRAAAVTKQGTVFPQKTRFDPPSLHDAATMMLFHKREKKIFLSHWWSHSNIKSIALEFEQCGELEKELRRVCFSQLLCSPGNLQKLPKKLYQKICKLYKYSSKHHTLSWLNNTLQYLVVLKLQFLKASDYGKIPWFPMHPSSLSCTQHIPISLSWQIWEWLEDSLTASPKFRSQEASKKIFQIPIF